MPSQSRFRFATAWLPEGWKRNVVIAIDPAGDIVGRDADDSVTTAVMSTAPPFRACRTCTVMRSSAPWPGWPSAVPRSHDSFWTWRETMYELAGRMTPELLNAVATQVYVDMLKAGYTSVCEFHYLHHPGGAAGHRGRRDGDVAGADRCRVIGRHRSHAAADALSDFRFRQAQRRRSGNGSSRSRPMSSTHWCSGCGPCRTRAQLEIGIALHSLRAVPPDAHACRARRACEAGVVHIHVAEQQREVAASLRASGVAAHRMAARPCTGR